MRTHIIDWDRKRVLVSMILKHPHNKVVAIVRWLPMNKVLVEHIRKCSQN